VIINPFVAFVVVLAFFVAVECVLYVAFVLVDREIREYRIQKLIKRYMGGVQ
jgi:membrane-anchored glycerophosphoryl diester phosphodiesterase (GDPDase)